MKSQCLPSAKLSTDKISLRIRKIAAGMKFKSVFPREKVRSLWSIGRLMSSVAKENDSRWIAAETGLSLSLLNACSGFYRLYQRRKPWQSNLSWDHYLQLSKVADGDARSFYEHEAVRHGWSPVRLKKSITDLLYESSSGVGESMLLADAGRRGKAVGSLHNHVQVASQLLS